MFKHLTPKHTQSGFYTSAEKIQTHAPVAMAFLSLTMTSHLSSFISKGALTPQPLSTALFGVHECVTARANSTPPSPLPALSRARPDSMQPDDTDNSAG